MNRITYEFLLRQRIREGAAAGDQEYVKANRAALAELGECIRRDPEATRAEKALVKRGQG